MIETARLLLRAVDEKDVPSIVAALNDWSVAQWLIRPPYPYRESDAHDFIRWTRAAGEDDFNAKFAIVDRATDALHGVVTIDPAQNRAELGYWLKASSAGQGYMSEAVKATLTHVRRNLPEVVVFATVDPENERSQRVLAKNGFRIAGTSKMQTKRKRGTTDALLFELPPTPA